MAESSVDHGDGDAVLRPGRFVVADHDTYDEKVFSKKIYIGVTMMSITGGFHTRIGRMSDHSMVLHTDRVFNK